MSEDNQRISEQNVGFQYARCFENERWYFLGWSSKLLPTDRHSWSDDSGRLKLDRDALAHPPHTTWCGDWELVVDNGGTTDAEGWSYALTFEDLMVPSKAENKNYTTACCRRRQWRRPFRTVTNAEQDAILKAGGNGRATSWQIVPDASDQIQGVATTAAAAAAAAAVAGGAVEKPLASTFGGASSAATTIYSVPKATSFHQHEGRHQQHHQHQHQHQRQPHQQDHHQHQQAQTAAVDAADQPKPDPLFSSNSQSADAAFGTAASEERPIYDAEHPDPLFASASTANKQSDMFATHSHGPNSRPTFGPDRPDPLFASSSTSTSAKPATEGAIDDGDGGSRAQAQPEKDIFGSPDPSLDAKQTRMNSAHDNVDNLLERFM